MIAHRLSTVIDSDCIYVLKKGEVVERGNHDQLVSQDGAYAELVKTQIAAEEQIDDVDDLELDRIQSKKE